MDGFEASYVIERPLAEVFAVLANLDDDVKWRDEWVDGKKLTEGPIGVGTRFSLVASLLGRRIETVYETIEHAPDAVDRECVTA